MPKMGGLTLQSPFVLDPAVLAELAELASTVPPVRESSPEGIGGVIHPMSDALRDSLLRLLALLDTPADIPVLGPMAERELLYRLLQGPSAGFCGISRNRKAR